MNDTSVDSNPLSGLQHLLQRRSAWPLGMPGPSAEALQLVLKAAACAPDHAGLVPWRIQVLQADTRHAVLERVLQHPKAQTPEVQALRVKYTAKLTTAPVVLVLAARIKEHPKAPEFEQWLSCGAAVMNMITAAEMQGLHVFWSSTPGTLGELLHDVMGFGPDEQMAGLLNIGTPPHIPSEPKRAPLAQYANIWQP